MKTIIGIYYYIALWCYAILKELISRVISILFFPIAYLMRDKLRSHLYSVNEELVKNRTFYDATINVPEDFYDKINKLYFFLWLFLDDSPAKDNVYPDGTLMYDASDRDKYYPQWVLDTKWFWLRATWWSFIRNNTVNYVSWFRTGGIVYQTDGNGTEYIAIEDYETYWGTYGKAIDKKDDNSRYVPGMYLVRIRHHDNKWYTRFTFIGEIFKHKVGVWQGRGDSGRFSFSVRA